MRPVGTSSPRPYGEIEEAIRQLVSEVGGFAEAGQIIQKSPSTISSYLDPEKKTSMTVGDLISLEKLSDNNPSIHFIARQFGYEIFKPIKSDGLNKWLEHISIITKEFSDLLHAAHRCLSDDGDIDAFESRRILKELDEHLSALCALRGDLVQCANPDVVSDLRPKEKVSRKR